MELRTSSRISVSEATSPKACSCTRTLPSAAASTGPASTGRRATFGGQLAEEARSGRRRRSRGRPRSACRSPLDLLEHEPVLAGEALEDGPDQDAALAGGRLLPAPCAEPRGSAPACRRGRAARAGRGRRAGRRRARAARARPCRRSSGPRAPRRPRRAGTPGRARGPSRSSAGGCCRRSPRSLVRLAARACSETTARVELDPDERPGAARDVGSPSLRPERDGDDRRGGVVRGDGDDRRRRRQPGRLGDVRAAARRAPCPARSRRGRACGRCRAARSASRAQVPVRTSRSWVVLAFVASATRSPREPVAEQVGDQEQRLGGGQRRALLERDQLEERVERQELDPGRLVDLLRR